MQRAYVHIVLFVSKVMGVDLVEIAAKVLVGFSHSIPAITIPAHYIGVEAPQFSFSQLSLRWNRRAKSLAFDVIGWE